MTGVDKILTALAICQLLSPSVAWTMDRPGDSDADGVAELLRSVNDPIAEEVAAPEGDLLLRSVLRRGFAQTPALPYKIEALFVTPVGSTMVPTLDTSVTRAVERETIATRLRLWEGGAAEAAPNDIPIVDHPLVDTYVKYFTGRGRWFFARWLSRADRYIPMMRPMLEAKGLPRDTVYLAMIESGFVAKAHSSASAVGFWQFIRSTGKRFKLRQDTWVDDRRDFVKSTNSAADYLKVLYKEFGDWQLAWAGYNAGGGRIRRALARYGVSDFWSLVAQPGSLAKETKHYVPKIMAAAIVASNREHYGFGAVKALPILRYDEVPVKDAVALRRVAVKLGVSLEDLQALNPSLLYSITPPRREFVLRVPDGRGAEVTQWLAALPRSERTDFRQHTVRSGDTLWEIAERYGSTINAIRDFNGIRNARVLGIGQRLIIPSQRGASVARRRPAKRATKKTTRKVMKFAVQPIAKAATPAAARSVAKTATASAKPVARHTVSAGETLWSISQRYRVSVTALKKWNRRRGNIIGVGDVLEIF